MATLLPLMQCCHCIRGMGTEYPWVLLTTMHLLRAEADLMICKQCGKRTYIDLWRYAKSASDRIT